MNGNAAESWYAPAQRSSPATLGHEVVLLTNNPVTDALLMSVDGTLAILDDNRQIVAVNQTFLDTVGLLDVSELLGLRPGEALSCIHAHKEPAGCGTSRACSSCGAVNAILAAQRENVPAERTCVLQIRAGSTTGDLVLRVRACPLVVEGERFILLFCQDVSRAQRLANLERVFLHDINNILQGLRVTSEMLAVETDLGESRTMGRHTGKLVQHLAREVELQRSLLSDDSGRLSVIRDHVPLAHVQAELGRLFSFHPAARDRQLAIDRDCWNTWIRTDIWVLVRILSNLVLNALEATPPGDRVEVRTTENEDHVTFTVWNRTAIPPEFQPRIFQRNFSSKADSGRGLGTYSAKLLGETLLEARVTFESTVESGTAFHVRLPR